MSIQFAVFDFDGTLLDSKPGIVNCFKTVGDEHGLDTRGIEDWIIGPPANETVRRLMPGCSETERRAFLSAFRARYAVKGWDECSLYDGAVDLLAELQKSGVGVYLCTSKRHDLTHRLLDLLKIRAYIRAAIGDHDELKSHDKRDLLAALIAKEGIDPTHCAMIGDSRYDIDAARACGAKAIAVLYGYGSRAELLAAKADAYCESPQDISAALEQL